jgi:hypothetical protein
LSDSGPGSGSGSSAGSGPLSAAGTPGAQAIAIAPPISASRKPTRKPPKLETTSDTSDSRIDATPAKTRTTGWYHMVSPSVNSRTPMTSEPEPAVVAIRTLS